MYNFLRWGASASITTFSYFDSTASDVATNSCNTMPSCKTLQVKRERRISQVLTCTLQTRNNSRDGLTRASSQKLALLVGDAASTAHPLLRQVEGVDRWRSLTSVVQFNSEVDRPTAIGHFAGELSYLFYQQCKQGELNCLEWQSKLLRAQQRQEKHCRRRDGGKPMNKVNEQKPTGRIL